MTGTNISEAEAAPNANKYCTSCYNPLSPNESNSCVRCEELNGSAARGINTCPCQDSPTGGYCTHPQPAELAEQQGDLVNPNDCESGPSGEWYCEAHPDALMGHGNCCGAGIPASARLRLALNWLRLERQKVRELHAQYGYLAEAALAATGQPQVGEMQGDGVSDANIDSRLNALHQQITASGQHNGGMVGVAWDRAVYRDALAATGKQQVGEVEGYALVASLVQIMNAEYDGLGRLPADVLGVQNMAAEALATQPSQGIDLGQLPAGWSLRTLATCYQLSDGNQVVGNFVGPVAKKNAALIAALIDSHHN